MGLEWKTKGCEKCRHAWLSGDFPPKLFNNIDRQAILHRCEFCGKFWEMFIRNADEVSIKNAISFYPDYFSSKLEDGIIYFEDSDLRVDYSLTESLFLKTHVGQEAEPVLSNAGYNTYNIGLNKILGSSFHCSLTFKDAQIQTLRLSIEDNSKLDIWSEPYLDEVKSLHKKWLKKQGFSQNSKNYSWGIVEVCKDLKSWSSSIILGYKND